MKRPTDILVTRKYCIEVATESGEDAYVSLDFPIGYCNSEVVDLCFEIVKKDGYAPVSYRFISEEEYMEKKENA